MAFNRQLICGSHAAKHWFLDFREPEDMDMLTQHGQDFPIDTTRTDGIESYWWGDSSKYILEHNRDTQFVDASFCYTVKAAHAKWDIHWDKTMFDIGFFQDRGVRLDDKLYDLALADFTAFHGKKWASLKDKTSRTFFEDAVTRKYVHDTVHEAVAYYDRPLFESILVSTNGVACSSEKFFKLSQEDRLKLIKEEVFVTALERYIVPSDYTFSRHRAYARSLKKLITTMSSGWFSKFIIENYCYLAKDKYDYVSHFKKNHHKLILC